MHLHLSLPDGLTADAHWFAADAVTAAVESSDDGDSDDEETSTTSTIVGFLPLLLIVVAVYFLLLRPRQRQMRSQRELQSSLEVGDEVMLTSGVYGFITGFETGSDVIWVEIDDDVQIRVSRAAISGKVDTSAVAAAAAATGEAAAAGTGAPAPAAGAPTAGTSRRPTLKGGAGKPTDATSGDDKTDEPAAE